MILFLELLKFSTLALILKFESLIYVADFLEKHFLYVFSLIVGVTLISNFNGLKFLGSLLLVRR